MCTKRRSPRIFLTRIAFRFVEILIEIARFVEENILRNRSRLVHSTPTRCSRTRALVLAVRFNGNDLALRSYFYYIIIILYGDPSVQLQYKRINVSYQSWAQSWTPRRLSTKVVEYRCTVLRVYRHGRRLGSKGIRLRSVNTAVRRIKVSSAIFEILENSLKASPAQRYNICKSKSRRRHFPSMPYV